MAKGVHGSGKYYKQMTCYMLSEWEISGTMQCLDLALHLRGCWLPLFQTHTHFKIMI